MKTIYFIGGTMGVGKTTVCEILNQKLDKSVFLDGDWCWRSNPFQVTEETKKMVVENICFLLNQFINCPAYKNIIFCWVMHKQEVIDNIVSKLNLENCRIKIIYIWKSWRFTETALSLHIWVWRSGKNCACCRDNQTSYPRHY